MDSLDDLDNALFGKNLAPQATSTAGEAKKKVVFKDSKSNLGPLEDFDLSDIDDDEDEDELGKKSSDLLRNNKIEDLFGVRKETTEPPSIKPADKGPSPKQLTSELKEQDFLGGEPTSKPSDSTPKMRPFFEDDDDANDVIDNLADRSKSKKTSLMENLFGSRPKSSSSSGMDSNARKDAFGNRKNSLDTLPDGSGTEAKSGFSLSAPKEPRRGRRPSSAVPNDPLGLLSASSLQFDDLPKTESLKQSAGSSRGAENAVDDLPEWLGGPKQSLNKKQDGSSDFVVKKSSTDLSSTIPVENSEQSALASRLLGLEFEQQAAMMSMQQQEHELKTAVSMARQSEKLNGLLEAQRTRLAEQEGHFGVLVAKQLERQAILEAQMKAQQERIDGYIRSLAAQPTSVPTAVHQVADRNKEVDESEALVQKLRLEKLYLENTVDSLKEKHEKEMSIVEDSYKKQIAFLEEAMLHMEKRMQDDVESIEADHRAKVQKLRDEISECHRLHAEEKETSKRENARLFQEIREQHARSFEVLQSEHLETIERITRSKQSERQALEIMRAEGTSVQNVLNKSQVIIEGLEDLHRKFEGRDVGFAASQTNHLSLQEKNMEYLKETLEKQKNDFVEEKQRLMDTIRNLEMNIDELTREFKAQSVNFKEAEGIMKSREQALLRDRELFAEQTTWERERLQAMRDSWVKEQDMQIEWLAKERQALAVEKGKLQIANRLKTGADETWKFELEASMRAAQEAAAAANQERLRWQEKTNELESQRKTLQDKEAHLVQRAKELQDLTKSAINKRDEGMRALKEARFVEERYKKKLSQLELQREILTQRESKLASEKLELARERLALRIGEDKPVKDTSSVKSIDELQVSRAGEQQRQANLSDGEICLPYSKDIVDPQLVLLRWELNSGQEISLPAVKPKV